MAEDQNEAQELTDDEKSKLKERLEDTGDENAQEVAGLKGKIQKILSNKKILIIGGGSLVLLLIIGVTIFFVFPNTPKEAPLKEEKKVKEEIIKDDQDKTTSVEKVNIYELDPFFVPILEDGKETGRFISLSANLLLSNSALHKEIERVLPLVRKKIYSILRKRRQNEFARRRSNIEDRIKKEIIVASNALLLTGTGTVTDVLFTSFIIK